MPRPVRATDRSPLRIVQRVWGKYVIELLNYRTWLSYITCRGLTGHQRSGTSKPACRRLICSTMTGGLRFWHVLTLPELFIKSNRAVGESIAPGVQFGLDMFHFGIYRNHWRIHDTRGRDTEALSLWLNDSTNRFSKFLDRVLNHYRI